MYIVAGARKFKFCFSKLWNFFLNISNWGWSNLRCGTADTEG